MLTVYYDAEPQNGNCEVCGVLVRTLDGEGHESHVDRKLRCEPCHAEHTLRLNLEAVADVYQTLWENAQ